MTAGYLALRTAALGDVIGARGMGPGQIPFWLNPVASAPTTTRVLTALEVLALALWRLVAPFRLSAAYYYRYVPVVSSPAEPGAALGLIVAAGLVGLAVVLWRRRVAFFCLALALATYGIVSNLVVPIGTLFGERFLYLPSVGFCTLVAMAFRGPTGTRWPRVAAAMLSVSVQSLPMSRILTRPDLRPAAEAKGGPALLSITPGGGEVIPWHSAQGRC